jgi:hypothetical protein
MESGEERRGEVREWWRGCFQEWGRRQRGEGKYGGEGVAGEEVR